MDQSSDAVDKETPASSSALTQPLPSPDPLTPTSPISAEPESSVHSNPQTSSRRQSRKKRHIAGPVTQNACTNCKKAKAKVCCNMRIFPFSRSRKTDPSAVRWHRTCMQSMQESKPPSMSIQITGSISQRPDVG